MRRKRIDLGLDQKEVATILGVSHQSIGNWELGVSKIRYRKYLPRVIEFLGYIPFELEGNSLGERMKFYRKVYGLTQRQFAERADVDPTTIGRVEKGIEPIARVRIQLERVLDGVNPNVSHLE